MGVVTADDAVARSTKANLEADTTAIYRESQRREKRLGVCMLNSLAPERLRGGVDGQAIMIMLCLLKESGSERPFTRVCIA